jgi:hypothetical protein
MINNSYPALLRTLYLSNETIKGTPNSHETFSHVLHKNETIPGSQVPNKIFFKINSPYYAALLLRKQIEEHSELLSSKLYTVLYIRFFI